MYTKFLSKNIFKNVFHRYFSHKFAISQYYSIIISPQLGSIPQIIHRVEQYDQYDDSESS